MRAAIGIRHQDRNIPPDHAVGRVSEDTFGGGIEGLDHALFVDGYDAVDGAIENRLEVGFT